MKNAELETGLKEVTATLKKIGAESTKTLDKVTALEEALKNADNVPEAVQTAFAELKAQATVVDDLIPDSTEETPVEETPAP